MKLTPLHKWIAGKIGAESGPFDRQRLATWQLEKLNQTLQLARQKSPFYASHLGRAPQHLSSLEDVQRLPFTTPDHILSQGLQMLCVSQGDIERVVTLDTSGTSGNPKRLYFTRSDQELTIDFFGVGMSTLVDPGDRVLILLPGERPGSVGDLLAAGLQRVGVTAIKHGLVSDPAQTLAIMRAQRVDSLVGVPVQVLSLARYRADDQQPVPVQLKSVLLSTDHVPDAIVRALKTAWGCEVYNHYGMTEMGLGGGVACAAQRGYHLREADLYFEIIDPGTGRLLPEGESGEVVFSTLTRQGMPLIRYRSGDISRFIPGDCPCGTLLKTLQWIKSRTNGGVRLGDQTITLADLDEALFAVEGLIHYSASVSRAGEKDCLAITPMFYGKRTHSMADIQNVLSDLPPVKKALCSGQLELRVSSQIEKSDEKRKLVKRRIIDNRGFNP